MILMDFEYIHSHELWILTAIILQYPFLLFILTAKAGLTSKFRFSWSNQFRVNFCRFSTDGDYMLRHSVPLNETWVLHSLVKKCIESQGRIYNEGMKFPMQLNSLISIVLNSAAFWSSLIIKLHTCVSYVRLTYIWHWRIKHNLDST